MNHSISEGGLQPYLSIQVLSPTIYNYLENKRIVEDPRDYVNQYFHYVLLHNKPPQNLVVYNKDVLFLIILNSLG